MNEGTIVFEFTLPSAWPPDSTIHIYIGRLDSAEINVFASPDSTIRFICIQHATPHEFVTPTLDIPNFANLKVAFTWSAGQQPMVAINGILISQEISQSRTALTINSQSQDPTHLREHMEVGTLAHLPLEDERLIRSLLELQNRIALADRIHLLEASGIIRRLLLDTSPLVHLVNREYHCKLLFPLVPEKATSSQPEGATYTYVNLAPIFSAPHAIVMLPLDDFLSQTAVKSQDTAFSVRDVINVCANTKGGIHFDKPRSDMAKQLLDLDNNFQPALLDASLHALADLSWCVLQGLKPLVSEIELRHNEN